MIKMSITEDGISISGCNIINGLKHVLLIKVIPKTVRGGMLSPRIMWDYVELKEGKDITISVKSSPKSKG